MAQRHPGVHKKSRSELAGGVKLNFQTMQKFVSFAANRRQTLQNLNVIITKKHYDIEYLG